MTNPKPTREDAALTDEELEGATGGTSRARGAAGEGAAVSHAATVAKQHRDAAEYREETGG